jgi:hypothetical protein
MKLEISWQILEKYSNIKFHENPFSGTWTVMLYGCPAVCCTRMLLDCLTDNVSIQFVANRLLSANSCWMLTVYQLLFNWQQLWTNKFIDQRNKQITIDHTVIKYSYSCMFRCAVLFVCSKRKMPGYNLQRRGTTHTTQIFFFLLYMFHLCTVCV